MNIIPPVGSIISHCVSLTELIGHYADYFFKNSSKSVSLYIKYYIVHFKYHWEIKTLGKEHVGFAWYTVTQISTNLPQDALLCAVERA